MLHGSQRRESPKQNHKKEAKEEKNNTQLIGDQKILFKNFIL